MRLALLAHRQNFALAAAAAPPRDRTSRTDKALAHCKAEWSRAYDIATANGATTAKAVRTAAVAYKLAMPKMDSLPAIRASISCIAQGITMEVFDGRDGSQLLYAAQVALSVLRQKGPNERNMAMVRPSGLDFARSNQASGRDGHRLLPAHIYRGEAWPLDEVLKRKAEIEAAGLVWSVVESIPVHNSIKLRSGPYRQYIAAWKDSLAAIAKAGVPVVCYNFMPLVDWTRTNLKAPAEHGLCATL